MKLLVDVGQLPASVFEEEFANQDESAREEVKKQSTEEDCKCPAVLAEEKCTIRDEELQLSHEIEGDSEQQSQCKKESVCDHARKPFVIR
jgi:hypothetical protein